MTSDALLFVTAVYDVYGSNSTAPEASRPEALWQRLAVIAPSLTPRLHVFSDRANAPAVLPEGVTVEALPLNETLTFRALAGVTRLPPLRNVNKDTAAYLKLQCAKAELLWRASEGRGRSATLLVWLDAGVSKVAPTEAVALVERLVCDAAALAASLAAPGAAKGASLIVPGCWPRRHPGSLAAAHMAEAVRWRFCGGLCAVPRPLAARFASQLLQAALDVARATSRLTWEVNLWELLESEGALPFDWRAADHDGSLLRCLGAPALQGLQASGLQGAAASASAAASAPAPATASAAASAPAPATAAAPGSSRSGKASTASSTR